MKNLKQKFLVGSFMLLSAFGFSQKPLSSSPNGEKIQKHLSQEEFKLTQQDIQGLTVNDEYYTSFMGLTLVYVGQSYQGIPIHNLISTVAVKDGEIFNVAGKFTSNIASKVNTVTPTISAKEAIEKVAEYFKLGTPTELKILSKNNNNYKFSNGNISSDDFIPVKLTYVQKNGKLILTQEVKISEVNGSNVWSVRVDALTGEIKKENIHNYKISCNFGHPNNENDHNHLKQNTHETINILETSNNTKSSDGSSYNVLPLMSDGSTQSVESPNHGSRQLIMDPSNPLASPNGWHDTDGIAGAEYTITRGNNVYAYENQNLTPPGYSPDGGTSLTFNYPFNQTLTPVNNQDAAITNLFYVNNMAHDIWYRYGFDEVSGNFQENNFGNGGLGNDFVNAQAQDGLSVNNAYMITQEDGTTATMEMQIFNFTNPYRDSDFDNLVILHEYGHGISIRLGGGPSTAQCLGGYEQGGEGWSDWMGLMLTMKVGDQGTDARGISTYLLGENTDGPGNRDKLYSTDFNINNFTYDDLKNLPSNPAAQDVGNIFATVLWDLTWAYVDKYGFSEDLYNGNAGNNKVMQLVLDGLKLMPCPPGFVDVRNSLLTADQASTGGENECIIWETFARRGLGFSADQGISVVHDDGTEAFDLPPSLDCSGSVGIDEQANNINFSIYPNPVNNKLTIKIKEQIKTITIMDIMGKTVKTITQKTIDVSDLTKGIYFLQIQTDKGRVSKKFIKK